MPQELKLRPYQRQGADAIKRIKKIFLCDDPGLGKTAQTITSFNELDKYPVLVACPKSLKEMWEAEIIKWGVVDKKILIINKMKRTELKDGYDIVIINYNLLNAHAAKLAIYGFKFLIIDESHLVKTPETMRSIALKQIAENIEYRVAITGTPILSFPIELYSQLNIIGLVKKMSKHQFGIRYCGGKRGQWGWEYKGATNRIELNQKLSTRMIRRTKQMVKYELPKVQKSVVTIQLTNIEEYREAESDFIEYVRREKGNNKARLAKRAEQIVKLNTLRQIAATGKIEATLEVLDSLIKSGERVIVFAHHKEVIDELKSRTKHHRPLIIDGATKNRHEVVTKFQIEEDYKVIYCSITAAAIGLTLTAASNVIFIETGWTPSIQDQAEARADRIGQTKPVTAHYIIGKNTVDQYIFNLIEDKRKVINEVVDGVTNESDSLEDVDTTSIVDDLINCLMPAEEREEPVQIEDWQTQIVEDDELTSAENILEKIETIERAKERSEQWWESITTIIAQKTDGLSRLDKRLLFEESNLNA